MAIDLDRLSLIVLGERANFPYVIELTAQRIIGYVHAKRDPRVRPMTDVKRAVSHFSVPMEQTAGYKRIAARYFNQSQIDRRGEIIVGRKKKRAG